MISPAVRVICVRQARRLRFTVIDTAGLEDATDESLPGKMRKLTEQVIWDICLFMIDARVGVTPTDETLAGILRKRAEHVILVANKLSRAGTGGDRPGDWAWRTCAPVRGT